MLIVFWTNIFKTRKKEYKGMKHGDYRNNKKIIKMTIIMMMILKVFYLIEVVIKAISQVRKEAVQENGKHYGLK